MGKLPLTFALAVPLPGVPHLPSPFNAPVRLHAALSRKLLGLPHVGCLPLGRPLLPDYIPWQCLSWLQV